MDEQVRGYAESGDAQYPLLSAPQEQHGVQVDLLARALDGIDYGVMVVQGAGEILLANRMARAELESASRIRVRHNKLAAYSLKSSFAIEHAIVDARNGLRRLVEIASSKGNLQLSFAPLFDTQDNWQATQGYSAQAVLVLIGKRELLNTASLAEFARIHGISSAEVRLLPALCEGATIKDMARQYGLSASTVRVHLKSIRRKTGTRSLRPLMLRLMALPPVLSLLET